MLTIKKNLQLISGGKGISLKNTEEKVVIIISINSCVLPFYCIARLANKQEFSDTIEQFIPPFNFFLLTQGIVSDLFNYYYESRE